MYKAILLALISCTAFSAKAQWSLNGNSGTNPPSNFIGTTDNKDLVFKTDNVERFKIAQGAMSFKPHTVNGDGIDIIDDTQNRNGGTDVVWIKSVYAQPNDIGLLTISSANWQYPIFSARENGKILMGITWNNTGLASCSDCNSYRLFVKDGIKTEKIKVDIASANGWADYVFDKDYKLKSLEDIKTFIDENKHLPEVPSTGDVLKNGVELKEMNVLLLKKVEELTLHLIQMNERLKKQDELIHSMKKRK